MMKLGILKDWDQHPEDNFDVRSESCLCPHTMVFRKSSDIRDDTDDRLFLAVICPLFSFCLTPQTRDDDSWAGSHMQSFRSEAKCCSTRVKWLTRPFTISEVIDGA